MKSRLSREDPERMDPLRGWETLLRPNEDPVEPADEERADASTASAADKSPWNDIASRAIERGYQVIEEQINEGRRIAENIRGYSDDVRKVNEDSSRLIERSLRFYTDVGYLWFELMESLLRSQALRADAQTPRNGAADGEARADPSNGNGNGHAAPGASRRDVEIEVISSSPTSVSLELRAGDGDALTVPPLHAADERKPPLTDIRFRSGEHGLVLRIKVPPGQPADTYSGVVVDGRSHQPKGTLCISVRSDETSS